MDDISSREYWDEVDSLAREALTEEHSGANLGDWLWESIDSHQWVIYTYMSQCIIRHSQNENYSAENFGPETVSTKDGIKWEAVAFGCLYGDVMDRIHEIRDDFEAELEAADEVAS